MGQRRPNNPWLGCGLSNARDAVPSLSPSLSRHSKADWHHGVPKGWRGLAKSHVPPPAHAYGACSALGWKLAYPTTSAMPSCPGEALRLATPRRQQRTQTGRAPAWPLGIADQETIPHLRDAAWDPDAPCVGLSPHHNRCHCPPCTPLLFLSVLPASSTTGKAAR